MSGLGIFPGLGLSGKMITIGPPPSPHAFLHESVTSVGEHLHISVALELPGQSNSNTKTTADNLIQFENRPAGVKNGGISWRAKENICFPQTF